MCFLTQVDYQIIDDETTDNQKEIFNLYPINHINKKITSFSSYYINNFDNDSNKDQGVEVRNKKKVGVRIIHSGARGDAKYTVKIQMQKVQPKRYNDSSDPSRLTTLDFSKTNFFIHDNQQVSNSMTLLNYSKNSCIIGTNKEIYGLRFSSISQTINDLSSTSLEYIICPKFTSGLLFSEIKTSNYNSKSTHVKEMSIKDSRITIDISDNIFDKSKYYLVTETNKQPMTITQLKDLEPEKLKKLEADVSEDLKSISKTIKIDNEKVTNIKLYAQNQDSLDLWWGYDLIQIGNAENSDDDESSGGSSNDKNKTDKKSSVVIIILIIIFSILGLVGVFFLIKYCLNKRKNTENRNELLR